jgi:Mrp family chromosome partitioning ATPase
MLLPLVRTEAAPEDMIASEAMKDLLRRLRREYDVVILDTKPVLGIANTRALAPMADAVVLLAEWRKTPRKAVETSLKVLERAGARVAGIVLTQVDMKQQSRTGYGDPSYYHKRYSKYYQE